MTAAAVAADAAADAAVVVIIVNSVTDGAGADSTAAQRDSPRDGSCRRMLCPGDLRAV
jgi:hypothetical protein